jgi:pimeloyl-ACP methyl ester carboxylesterase
VAALALFDQMIAERDEPIVVIGHGFGALLATEVARARPAATKALVAVGFGESSTTDGTPWWKALMEANDAKTFVEQRHHAPGTLSQAARRRIDEALAAPAWRAFLDEEATAALARGFSGLSLPTLLVMGEGDRLVPRAAVEEVARRVPSARLEWLARCGHAVPVERPQELLLMINLFLYQRSK